MPYDASESELPIEAFLPTAANALAREQSVERAKKYARTSKADATRNAYAADLRDFEAYCAEHGEASLPASPQTVALYFSDLASTKSVPKNPRARLGEMVEASVSTIKRRMVAIAQAHKIAGHPNPVADRHVREIVQGIKRNKGSKQRKKTALTGDLLPDALRTIDADEITGGGITPTLKGKRDRAILLLTFATACRRSEIAALNLEDLRFEKAGLIVTIRRSKVDQTCEGREIGVPLLGEEEFCAVRAVREWIIAAGLAEGPLFRTFNGGKKLTANRIDPIDVSRLVKRVTGNAGIEGDFGAHSLRAGFMVLSR